MDNIKLTLASGDYDRIRPLWDGGVQVEGIDLNVLRLPVEEIFFRMARFQDFDVSEMSLASFLISKSKGTHNFTAIPAFPSKKFRFCDVYINANSGIKRAEDLRGKRIGTPEYQMTACVWMRGIMEEFYGVKATEVEWYSGGSEKPGREERMHLELPPEFKVRHIAKDQTLLQMLKNNEIDAIFTARVPTPFTRGEEGICRLWPNFKEVEQDYYRKTGIFPIMHTVVLREDTYRKYPWAAKSIYKAYCDANELNMARIDAMAALPVTLPWFNYELDETRALMGKDFWKYGLEPNRATIEKLMEYMKVQGLLDKDFAPAWEELFAPNTLAFAGI